jgi:ABC-type cobalt transport system substrate-binding protein
MDFLKKNAIVPIVVGLAIVFFVIKTTNFSVIDMIANRVIEKMQLKYSPYGPQRDAE